MEKVEHLIQRFVPEHYELFLDINRKDKVFSGRVLVKGEALEQTVAFHQKDLSIETVRVAGESLNFTVNDDLEEVRFELAAIGQQDIELTFSGQITDGMTGMYPSYYQLDGVKKEVISTQFESHFARQVFPSIDEPAAKATFDLTITFDQQEGEIVLANMPERLAGQGRETGIWAFETSPRMSTYLLAFAIGELHSQLTTTKSGVEVGIFATKAHQSSSLDFALDFAKRVLEFYEDYFGVPYPLKQCYHLALPDFSAGAMENWGLITYREIYLLADDNSSLMSRQQIALVIAHEVAHQWFGNLVTMSWWDDLWLNESFAMMMENLAVDALEPSWQIKNDFNISSVPHALNRDAIDGVQSVHVAVNHPDEIQTLFDSAIVYSKGSRLMFMLYHWLGKEAFVAGLKDYFVAYQYGNTVGQDLWQALSHHSDKDAADFMTAWLEQPGFPVVTAKVVDDNLILSQKQFFVGQHKDQGRLWPIPLNSNWTGLPETLTQESLVIPHYSQLAANNTGALRLNLGNNAHYITAYQGQLLDDLMADFASLSQLDKLQLVQEFSLLAEGGVMAYADLLPFLDLLSDDSSYPIVSAQQQIIAGLRDMIDENSPAQAALKERVNRSLMASYEQLGFDIKDSDSDETEKARLFVLLAMTWAGNEQVIAQARAIYDQYATNMEDMPASLRQVVLSTQVMVAESQELVDAYLAQYVKTHDARLRSELCFALSRTKSQETVNKILAVLKDKDVIKPQDLSTWYYSFLRSDFAQEAFWTWGRENWQWLKETFAGDMSYADFVESAADVFKTEERLAEFKAFYEPEMEDLALKREIVMGLRNIDSKIELIKANKAALEAALEDN
ncbi:M1 family metallopeptidase [Streptococcus cuniculipharyngis]|uniref:Aminopeptidase n=1 Tax=Streptococcus cuniculipharyngis TaxID=1562651 RepID=A0A5C5SD24_9STRE|nr:M1 family metallopeptidase [Streptococcus cuniculipharyngis]TWS98987.1 M1 family metallopeptidase [Streptococcus cuniculipharyngis]